MTPIAYLTSQCDHGGEIITASPDKTCNGLAVARLNDIVNCVLHGPNPIVSIAITQETDSLQTANVTCIAACGAVIITGSPDMYVG